MASDSLDAGSAGPALCADSSLMITNCRSKDVTCKEGLWGARKPPKKSLTAHPSLMVSRMEITYLTFAPTQIIIGDRTAVRSEMAGTDKLQPRVGECGMDCGKQRRDCERIMGRCSGRKCPPGRRSASVRHFFGQARADG